MVQHSDPNKISGIDQSAGKASVFTARFHVTAGMVGRYAGQLAGGATTNQLQMQIMREYGTSPMAQAMGYTPGSAMAQRISGLSGATSMAQAQSGAALYSQLGAAFGVMGMSPGEQALAVEESQRLIDAGVVTRGQELGLRFRPR